MSSIPPNTNLAEILATLASLAPQNQQTSQSQTLQYAQQHTPQHAPQQFVPPPVVHASPPQLGNPAPLTQSNAPKVRLVDPATIIDWSAGLKCVMRTVAKNETIIGDIKRMIKSQHEHEQQWWRGREDLITRQKARKEGQKKLDEVLKLVGGTPSSGTSNTSPEELAMELQTFDMKVHRAQTQMMKEFSLKLKSLGVPFFGTKVELIKKKKKDAGEDGDSQEPSEGEGVIDELEFLKLQAKMVNLLEDLCGD